MHAHTYTHTYTYSSFSHTYAHIHRHTNTNTNTQNENNILYFKKLNTYPFVTEQENMERIASFANLCYILL